MSRYATYIDPIIGGLPPHEVTVAWVSRVLEYVESFDLAAATRRQVMLLVKGILRAMEIRGLIDKSPFYHEEHLPKLGKQLPKPLTAGQVEAILAPDAFTRPWHRLCVLLGLTAGFRRSDMLDFRFDQIDRENQRVRLVGKGQKEAVIPYTPELHNVVEWWVENRPTRSTDSYVLPIRSRNSFRWVARSWERIGFRWNLHQTRHTFACSYLDAGGSLKALSQILRHESIKTTEGYARISNRPLVLAAIETTRRMLRDRATYPQIDPQTETERRTRDTQLVG